jgi:ribosome-associated protein
MSLRQRHNDGSASSAGRSRRSTNPWYTARAPSSSEDGERSLDEQTLARRIVEIASDKQASDIVLLDIRPVATVADYFVVLSTASDRQMSAVVRDLEDVLREEADIRPLRIEGRAASGWVLMDYGDVIVHIFSAEQRAFYRLEELWSTAVPLVRVQ